MAVLLDPTKTEHLDFAQELLLRSLPVALPTETVYGLAAKADSPMALARIFALKARPEFDPLILHVLDSESVRPWVKSVSPLQQKLMDKYWPGPMTLLFEKTLRVPDLCTASTDWVAMRAPEHPVFREILARMSGIPLAAPSANRFTSLSPTQASDVLEELGPWGLEAVVDGGPCRWGLESTVLKVLNDTNVEVIRPGALSLDRLKEDFPNLNFSLRASGSGARVQHDAPGQSLVHYAPKTKLYLVEPDDLRESTLWNPQSSAFLKVFDQAHALDQKNWKLRLSLASSSGVEAASKLFSTLRNLDKQNLEAIVVLAAPSSGLGIAINDRLRRAAQKR